MLRRLLLWITIGYGSLVTAQMDLSALSKTTKEPQQVVDVGSVNEVTGFAQIERDESFAATKDFVVQSYDKAQTEAGLTGRMSEMSVHYQLEPSLRLIAILGGRLPMSSAESPKNPCESRRQANCTAISFFIFN